MRHHNREILPPCFPGKEGSNAIDVEATLAHINEGQRRPEMDNATAKFKYTAHHQYMYVLKGTQQCSLAALLARIGKCGYKTSSLFV